MLCDAPESCCEYIVSCDYGTKNPSSFGLWGRCGQTWYRLREYYYDGRKTGRQKTDEEYVTALAELCGEAVPLQSSSIPRPQALSGALTSGLSCREGGKRCSARHTAHGPLLKSGRIRICRRGCNDTVREFYQYRWDERAGKEAPLKQNDHAMDDIRYLPQAFQNLRRAWALRGWKGRNMKLFSKQKAAPPRVQLRSAQTHPFSLIEAIMCRSAARKQGFTHDPRGGAGGGRGDHEDRKAHRRLRGQVRG